MGNDIKEEYLNKKYAEYDDESDMKYKKRKYVHKKVKKANHKHEYENVVVVDPAIKDSFYLIGRCPVCGKISEPVKDSVLERKFPNIQYHMMFIAFAVDSDEEYKSKCEDFKNWCKEHYTVYEVDGFKPLFNKYL